MNDRNGANELFNVIKTIVNNYLNNRKVAAVVIGGVQRECRYGWKPSDPYEHDNREYGIEDSCR